MIIVDENYVPQDLYNLYTYAQLLGSMAVHVQNFAGAHCYIRDQKSKKPIEGFKDISFGRTGTFHGYPIGKPADV